VNNNSILERKIHPFKQAAVIAGIVTLIILLIKLGSSEDTSPRLYWEIAASGLLFYAIANSILSIAFEDQNYYWLYSIMSFALLLLSCGGLAFLCSGITIDEAGSFRWIFLVFTMGYIILLAIVRTMKKIITIAQREDKRLRGEE